MEKKLIDFAEVKFAANESDTKTSTFSGYGAVFNNVDSYGDVIAKGAFAASLKSGVAPLMVLNHDFHSLPIGKWTSLEEDDFGLKLTGEFLDTVAGRDTYTASKAGAITGLSIGYRPIDVVTAQKGDAFARLIKSVELLEVSVVTFPANDLARIEAVKSMDDLDEFARKLVRSGMSIEEAKSFLSAHAVECRAKYDDALSLAAANDLLAKIRL